MGDKQDNVLSFINSASLPLKPANDAETQYVVDMRNFILQDVLKHLPAMFKEFMEKQHVAETTTPIPKQAEQLIQDVSVVQSGQSFLDNKVAGLSKKIDTWTESVTALSNKIKVTQKEVNDKLASIKNKTREYAGTQTKVKKTLSEMSDLEKKLQTSLQSLKTIDGKKVIEVEGSQDFLSSQYDDVIRQNDEIKVNIEKLSKKVEMNTLKAERNANYPRYDCVEFGGVPQNKNNEDKEDCKSMVINICKEMNLSLREDSISTAHRLKQHPSKTGPPPIIVKFGLRDTRNEVYALRNILKLGETNINVYGIKTLYINESLTPEKRKLLYEAKKFRRNLSNDYGRIFVWTFKGDVYMRQNVSSAPSIKIINTDGLREFEKSLRTVVLSSQSSTS